MAATPLESVLRRDRLVVVAALCALVMLCWAYLGWMAATAPMVAAPDDAGSAPMETMSAGFGRWSAAQFLAMLLMWSVMMVGMMTPSVAPMILIYARVARHASTRGTPFAPSAWFALGYFLAWIGFALLATVLQWGLERALLLSPMMARAGAPLGGALLITAGLYQWTPLKNACLSQCQSPLAFIQRHGGFRGKAAASVAMGLRHGAYCIGCCWALMILLFAAGVMNLLWIAAIGALALAEKLIPGRLFQRLAGVVLIVSGAAAGLNFGEQRTFRGRRSACRGTSSPYGSGLDVRRSVKTCRLSFEPALLRDGAGDHDIALHEASCLPIEIRISFQSRYRVSDGPTK